VRPLARRAACAVSDRNEARLQRRERLDRIPELCVHLFRLGREEFERHADIAGKIGEQGRVQGATRFLHLRKR
jgi:hypothetical protein